MHDPLPPDTEVYLVGGAVRDKLLGRPAGDRDWVVVGASPALLLDRGFKPVGNDFPVFLHPHSGEEYALARTERKQGQGHRGFQCYSDPDVTLKQDLQRRDLTINAMAEDSQGNIIDPWRGRGDLEKRILRHVSPAFQEDPLRVLRCARFCAQLGELNYTVHRSTLKLMRAISAGAELQTLPVERIWRELWLALLSNTPAAFFQTLQQCGALANLFPEWCRPQAATVIASLNDLSADHAPSRLALLGHAAGSDALSGLLSRLHPPGDARRLLTLGAGLLPLAANLGRRDSAEHIAALLQRADYLRRPETLPALAHADAVLRKDPELISILKNCAQRYSAVNAQALIAADPGLKGPELGRALGCARQKAIAAYLEETHSE